MASRQLIDIILRITKQGMGLQEAKRELGDVEQVSKNAGDTFGNMVSTIGKVAVAVGGMAAAFATLKKAYDFGKEGANIAQTAESFDRLMASMGVGPDILQRLRDASLNTVDDMSLMSSTMTMLAGTSDLLGQKMAESSPQLLKIAKAAQALNPAAGDVEFFYSSITSGIKRSSPLILDNLGLVIKIGEATEDFAEKLGKSAEELTAEERQLALLEAALEAGDRMIQQVGGDVSSMGDDFAQAEVKIKNAADRLKVEFYPVVADVMDSTVDAGETAHKMGIMFTAALKSIGATLTGKSGAQAWDHYFKSTEEYFNLVKKRIPQAMDGYELWAEAQRNAQTGTEDFTDALGETNVEQHKLNVNIATSEEVSERAARAYGQVKIAAETMAEKERDAAAAADEFKNSMYLLDAAMRGEVGQAFDDYNAKLEELDQALAEGEIDQAEYATSVQAVTDAYRENTREIAFNIAEKQILDALEKGLIEDVNKSGTAFDEANTILWTLAQTMGLTDEKTVNFMGSAQDLTQALIDGKITNEEYATMMKLLADNADTASGSIDGIASAINSLPDSKHIDITVQTTYTFEGTQGGQQGGMGGGQAFNYQHGGQFRVRGPGGIDRVPVGFMATSGEVVTVTPVGGTPPPNPAVTNNYNLNVTSTQPSAGIIQDFGIMQDLIQ